MHPPGGVAHAAAAGEPRPRVGRGSRVPRGRGGEGEYRLVIARRYSECKAISPRAQQQQQPQRGDRGAAPVAARAGAARRHALQPGRGAARAHAPRALPYGRPRRYAPRVRSLPPLVPLAPPLIRVGDTPPTLLARRGGGGGTGRAGPAYAGWRRSAAGGTQPTAAAPAAPPPPPQAGRRAAALAHRSACCHNLHLRCRGRLRCRPWQSWWRSGRLEGRWQPVVGFGRRLCATACTFPNTGAADAAKGPCKLRELVPTFYDVRPSVSGGEGHCLGTVR